MDIKNGGIIESAIEFLEKIKKESAVSIRFRKKTTNELRDMRCTLDFSRIPLHQRPKGFDFAKALKLISNNQILHVFDLDKQEWRSVPFDRVIHLDIDNIRYSIKK